MKKRHFLTYLIIGLFLLFYTFYRSEIYNEGEIRVYYFKYYLLSLIFIVLAFLTFFVEAKINQIIFICFISSTIGLYIAETYYVFSKPVLKTNVEKKKTFYKKYYLKDKTIKIVVPITDLYSIHTKYYPLSQVSNSKLINCNENGYYSFIQTDRYGFNNDDSIWRSEQIDILLIGDSFIFGSCVNKVDDIASSITTFSKRTTLNLSQNGFGPLSEYAVLREFYPKNTKNIFWFYFEGNDLDDLNSELFNPTLSNYVNDINYSQNLKEKTSVTNYLNNDVLINYSKKENFKKIKKIIKLTSVRQIFSSTSQKDNKNSLLQFKKIITNANLLAKSNDANFYFIFLPEYARYSKNMLSKNDNNNSIKKFLIDQNIDFVDIDKELFSKLDDPLKFFPFRLSGHYTPEGYREIGRTIIDKIGDSIQ